jgi:hypothetical protein
MLKSHTRNRAILALVATAGMAATASTAVSRSPKAAGYANSAGMPG